MIDVILCLMITRFISDGLIPMSSITNIRRKRAHDKESRVARVQVSETNWRFLLFSCWLFLLPD